MALQFTFEQKLALCRDRHISVTANAGSGKTGVLISRYIDLILNDDSVDLDPRRVLAITFTKMAASEMTARAVRMIEDLIINESNINTLKKLNLLRQRMTYSNISTIHSFCLNLLREYPLEAGISPNFGEIDETDSLSLVNSIVDDTLDTFFNSEDEDILHFLKKYYKADKMKNLKAIILKGLKSAEVMNSIENLYDEEDGFILFKKNLDAELAQTINQNSKNLASFFNNPDDDFIDNPKYIDTYNNLHIILNKLSTSNSSVEIFDLICSLSSILKIKVKGNSTLNSIHNINNNNQSKALKENLIGFEKYDNLFKEDKQLEHLYMLSYTIYKIISFAIDSANKAKSEMNVIDFDDMIIKTSELLQNEDIAAKVRKSYSHILIDEFQDTNPIQYQIIKKLIPSLAGIEVDYEPKCFIVGDGKQSIYAFRNADVRVFMQAISDIEKLNTQLISEKKLKSEFSISKSIQYHPDTEILKPNTDLQNAGKLSLSASFRLRPVIASFVNFICSEFMNEETKFDINYEPLVFARETEKYLPMIESASVQNNSLDSQFGSVKFLYSISKLKSDTEYSSEETAENATEEDSPNEAKMVADYINYIVSDESEYKIEDKFGIRSPKYSDITILVRTKTSTNSLATALLSNEIPFLMHSSKGFFKAAEINEITNILKFLSNPTDELAFCGAVQSMFFGLSIRDLFSIAASAPNTTLWEKFKYMIENESERVPISSQAKFKQVYNVFRLLLDYSTKIPLAQLIIKVIESCGIYAEIVDNTKKDQILSNLDKFVAYARNYEKKGFRGIHEFVKDISDISDESSEGDANFSNGENAVNIMTIHSSKGKEFPIVILYNSNAGTRNLDSEIIDSELGVICKSINYKEEIGVYEYEDNILTKLGKNKSGLVAKAELKRLVYTALTRAKDYLIISATFKESESKNQEIAPISKSIKKGSIFELLSNHYPELEQFETNFSLEISNNLDYLHNSKIGTVNIRYNVDILLDLNNLNTSKLTIKYQKKERMLLLDKPIIKFRDEIFSASKACDFHSNSHRYLKKYFLGFENDNDNQYLNQFSEKSQLSGADIGIIFHSILEKINTWLNPDSSINNTLLDNLIERKAKYFVEKTKSIDGSPTISSEELSSRIRTEAVNTANTKLIKEYSQLLNKAKFEYELRMPFQDDFITGIIDTLVEHENGDFEVWDWKSNYIDSIEKKTALESHYSIQMKLYLYFIRMMNPNQKEYKARLLFTHLARPDAEHDQWTSLFKFSAQEIDGFSHELLSIIRGSAVYSFMS